jgi:hypothetical protein
VISISNTVFVVSNCSGRDVESILFNTCEMIARAVLLVLMVLSSQVVAVGEPAPETYEFTAEVSRYAVDAYAGSWTSSLIHSTPRRKYS